jgi:hypothetical protein
VLTSVFGGITFLPAGNKRDIPEESTPAEETEDDQSETEEELPVDYRLHSEADHGYTITLQASNDLGGAEITR